MWIFRSSQSAILAPSGSPLSQRPASSFRRTAYGTQLKSNVKPWPGSDGAKASRRPALHWPALAILSCQMSGIAMQYIFVESRSVAPEELNALFLDVGWGRHATARLQLSIDAYPFVAHARTGAGTLVGYVSAFSDGVFSTMLGELVVHPAHRRHGVDAELLARVEARFPHAPVYIKALGESKHFFMARGYKSPKPNSPHCSRSPWQRRLARKANSHRPVHQTPRSNRHLPRQPGRTSAA